MPGVSATCRQLNPRHGPAARDRGKTSEPLGIHAPMGSHMRLMDWSLPPWLLNQSGGGGMGEGRGHGQGPPRVSEKQKSAAARYGAPTARLQLKSPPGNNPHCVLSLPSLISEGDASHLNFFPLQTALNTKRSSPVKETLSRARTSRMPPSGSNSERTMGLVPSASELATLSVKDSCGEVETAGRGAG